MSAVVVWLTKGGYVEYVAPPGVEVVVIDFQNLANGDEPPDLSDAHKALLQESAPNVLKDIEAFRPVKQDWWPVPQSALDRHLLSGRFNVAPEAMHLVQGTGLDRVLSWFETTKGVGVEETVLVGDTGLKAYFGFDPDKPNGECFFVNISPLR